MRADVSSRSLKHESNSDQATSEDESGTRHKPARFSVASPQAPGASQCKERGEGDRPRRRRRGTTALGQVAGSRSMQRPSPPSLPSPSLPSFLCGAATELLRAKIIETWSHWWLIIGHLRQVDGRLRTLPPIDARRR